MGKGNSITGASYDSGYQENSEQPGVAHSYTLKDELENPNSILYSGTKSELIPEPETEERAPKQGVEKDVPFARKLEAAALTGPLDLSESLRVSQEAETKVLDPEFDWNGETNKHILEIVSQVRESTLNEIGGFFEMGKPLPSRVNNEVAKRVVAKVRGWLGDRFSAVIPLAKAETKVISVDEVKGSPMQSRFGRIPELHSVSEMFGGTRKNLILQGLYLLQRENDEEFINEIATQKRAKPDVVKALVDETSKALLDFNKAEDEYEGKTRQPIEIVRNRIKKRIIEGSGGTERNLTPEENRVIDELWSRSSGDMFKNVFAKTGPSLAKEAVSIVDEVQETEEVVRAAEGLKTLQAKFAGREELEDVEQGALGTAKKAYNRALERGLAKALGVEHADLVEKSYYGKTVPDALAGDPGQMAVAAEVKTYSKEYMNEWLDALEYTMKLEEEGKSLLAEGYIVNGLQVFKIEPEFKPWETGRVVDRSKSKVVATDEVSRTRGILKAKRFGAENRSALRATTYGFDIEAQRNFVKAGNIDVKDERLIPVVLRLPADITDEQIQRLHNIAVKKGITNFVIQKFVSLPKVDNTARKIIHDSLIPYATTGKSGVTVADISVLKALEDPALWKE